MLLADQNKIHLALGVHNHQPIGNWDWVIEDSYQHSYLPFIDVLERHPRVHVTIHYAGHLLAWLAEHHPEFTARLRAMVERGQIELITGGYYEPILAAIPDADKIGQVRKLTQAIQQLVGTEPVGLWLTGRIWEPYLAKPLAEAGVRYTILDDTHFKAAGLHGADLLGYFQTEEQGEALSLFPNHEDLRAMIPFQPPERVIDFLAQNATQDGTRVAVCFDDGEKFGGWPDTYQAVYLDGWLDRFFTLLEENQDWISSVTLDEYRQKQAPWGRIYVPSCSYQEMQVWALQADQAVAFDEARSLLPPRYHELLRGGDWRNFLIKYPEANNLHKKMLHVAGKLKAAEAEPAPSMVGRLRNVLEGATSKLGKGSAGPAPKPEPAPPPVKAAERARALEEAKDALWRGQSNDPYWHGVFGGVYLNHLRAANYGALLQAEAAHDKLRHGDAEFCELEVTDFDRDGQAEALVSTKDQNLYFTPGYGGALFEHDVKRQQVNLLATLSRKLEAYHTALPRAIHAREVAHQGPAAIGERVITKEAGLERYLHYDWYRRFSLLDHFLHPDTRLETFYNMSYGEQGDFINQAYALSSTEAEDGLVIKLSRDGHVWIGPEFWPVTVAKEIRVPRSGSGFVVDYQLTNGRDRAVELWFGVELNLNMRTSNDAQRRFYSPSGRHVEPASLSATAADEHIAEIGLHDKVQGLDIQLGWSVPGTLWRFPLETVSRSESGFERVYQSTVMLPHWRVALEAGGTWSCRITQRIAEI
jgi:4-alpha-glucanotransferase